MNWLWTVPRKREWASFLCVWHEKESSVNMSQRQTTSAPKKITHYHAVPFHLNPTPSTRPILSVRNVPKVSGDVQVSFQLFIKNKGHPCRERFLMAAATLHPDWSWRKTMTGGGLLETTGRPSIGFANRAGDPNLTLPCTQWASTSLIPQPYFSIPL